MEERILRAFREVLARLNDGDLSRFLDDISPTVMHVGDWCIAFASSLYVPPNLQEKTGLTQKNVLYLSPRIEKDTDEQLRDTLAHEIAHFLLGHHEIVGVDSLDRRAQYEQEADSLSKSWGFSPIYSPNGKENLREGIL